MPELTENTCSGTSRLWIVGGLGGILGLLELCSLPESLMAIAIYGGLSMIGYDHLHFVNGTTLCVNHQVYVIEWFCTPVVLSLCSMTLLWFARQRPREYLVTCVVVVQIATILVLGGTIGSIWLHSRGVSWIVAHYPQAITVYTCCLVACVFFAESWQQGAKRRIDENTAVY